MAFYNGLGKKIQQTGQGAIDKTKRSAEVARLNGSVSGLEKEITKQYEELGKVYYQKYAGEVQDPDLIPYFQAIDEKVNQIAGYKDQISQLKGNVKCPSCGREISGTAVFCNYCGARQVAEFTSSAASGRTCPNCGAPLEENAVFCSSCGTNVANAAPAEEDTQRRCVQCGEPLDDDAVFCPNCGQKNELPAAGEPEVEVVVEVEEEPEVEVVIEVDEDAEEELVEEIAEELEAEEVMEEVLEAEAAAEAEEVLEEEVLESEAEPTPAANVVLFCTNCGSKLAPGDAFCTNCGTKIER